MPAFSSAGRIAPEPERLAVADWFDLPCAMVPLRVVPLSAAPDGPRLVVQPGSGLLVGVAPIGALDTLLGHRSFQRGGGYATLSTGTAGAAEGEVRPGDSSDLPRRLREHVLWPPHRVEKILLVGPADPVGNAFGKDASLLLQWILHRLAVRADRVAVIGAAAPRPLLIDTDPQLVARWVADLRPMMVAAGVLAFEPRDAVLEPRRPPSTDPGREGAAPQPVGRGFATMLPRRLTERPQAACYRLAWNGVTAQATVADGWTILHAGSTADPVDRPDVQPCIAAKRLRLVAQGVLQRTGGGLLRLTHDIAVPSLTNAVRVLTGTNEPGTRFEPTA